MACTYHVAPLACYPPDWHIEQHLNLACICRGACSADIPTCCDHTPWLACMPVASAPHNSVLMIYYMGRHLFKVRSTEYTDAAHILLAGHLLMAEWNNSVGRPCHYVAADLANHCIVVAIR